MSTGVALIEAERRRQIDEEGYDAEHDRGAATNLALAGASYALPPELRGMDDQVHEHAVPVTWPWDPKWWKPTPGNRVREMVKAGALIAAAIDALVDEGYAPTAEGQEKMGLE